MVLVCFLIILTGINLVSCESWESTASSAVNCLNFFRCLSPDQVMLQLKYRYDREIDNSER